MWWSRTLTSGHVSTVEIILPSKCRPQICRPGNDVKRREPKASTSITFIRPVYSASNWEQERMWKNIYLKKKHSALMFGIWLENWFRWQLIPKPRDTPFSVIQYSWIWITGWINTSWNLQISPSSPPCPWGKRCFQQKCRTPARCPGKHPGITAAQSVDIGTL